MTLFSGPSTLTLGYNYAARKDRLPPIPIASYSESSSRRNSRAGAGKSNRDDTRLHPALTMCRLVESQTALVCLQPSHAKYVKPARYPG